MRSKTNPRSLVFTIGFSAGVVGLAMAKGTKTNAKPMQNRFSLTPNRARRPFGVSLRTFDQRRSLCPRRYGCYRRLREIPQQVVRRQIVLNPPGGENENMLSSCPSRAGNRLYGADIRPTKRRGRSKNSPADSCAGY